MNKHRLPMMIVIVSLVAVSILAAWTFQRTNSARVDNQSLPSGMGDLRYYESQQILPNTGGDASESAASAGMGDLRYFEAQDIIPNTGREASYSAAHAGMGDLRYFEAQQILANTGSLARRVDCPGLSTTKGERDAGASAPAYVLQKMGCAVSDN